MATKKKFNPGKWYNIYYCQKGAKQELSYIGVKARTITEAKRQAKSEVHRIYSKLKGTRGAIQLNQFMKTLKFYTKY